MGYCVNSRIGPQIGTNSGPVIYPVGLWRDLGGTTDGPWMDLGWTLDGLGKIQEMGPNGGKPIRVRGMGPFLGGQAASGWNKSEGTCPPSSL